MLYKYYSNESKYALDNIKNNVICFTPIELLNDPLEGVGAYKYTVSKEEQAYWDSIGSDAPKYLEKYFVEDVRDLLNFNHRIFSTSNQNDNPLLWAHYANSHKGFCVGYEEQSIEDISNRLSNVNYSEQQPHINLEDPESFEQLLFVKSSHWSYENECRAIYTLKDEDVQHLNADIYISDSLKDNDKIYHLHGHVQTNNLKTLCSQKFITKRCVPKSIYFGINMTLFDKRRLIHSVENNNVDFFQITQSHNSFNLSIEKIPQDTIQFYIK